MKPIASFALVFLCAACSRAPDAQERARADAAAVAQVEAAQDHVLPARPIMPQGIAAADLHSWDIPEGGCTLSVPNRWIDPIIHADGRAAVIKLDGDPEIMASDSGSGVIGTIRNHYVGRRYTLRIKATIDPDTVEGGRKAWQNVAMTIRDADRRVVFDAVGVMSCAA